MKAALLPVLLGCFVWRVSGQGTINFANGAAGVNAPVKLEGSGQPLEGAGWKAELLLVSRDGSSKRMGEPVPFQTGAVAGYFLGGLTVVSGVEAGASATFRVRAFDAGGTAEAASNPVTVMLGGEKMPPPNLVGLQSWTVRGVPKPALQISRSTDGIKLSWVKEITAVAIESADSVAQTNWMKVATPPVLMGEEWTVAVSADGSARYYRLRLK